MTDQFSLPNSQYMITTMTKMGFYSKPLLDICSRKIAGKKKPFLQYKIVNYLFLNLIFELWSNLKAKYALTS